MLRIIVSVSFSLPPLALCSFGELENVNLSAHCLRERVCLHVSEELELIDGITAGRRHRSDRQRLKKEKSKKSEELEEDELEDGGGWQK